VSNDIEYWIGEIEDARKRDKEFREDGKRIIEIYTCDKEVPFNILYANTDTLLPALYSAVPRPTVKPRFKHAVDPLTHEAAKAAQKMLEYLLDTGVDGYETFDEGLRNATLDALLPGRGITRIKYDADIQDDVKKSELVCIDSIVWDRMLVGYSKKWSTVPWIAFEEHIDKKEAVRLFGEEIAKKLKFLKNDDNTEDENAPKEAEEKQGGIKTACIYQIWDKDNRKVRYLSPQNKDDFLKVDDDPLELSGFYPIPKPIEFIEKSHDLTVIAPYLLYENQAKELNTLSTRIIRLSNSIKAKGIYDAELGSDIENLMRGDDNQFIPADKSSALAAEKGFQNAIWFMPIVEMSRVLTELLNSREQCKQVIYEVTGISDIIRGSTDANETATAQGIKSQWGTMRLKRMQSAVQTYARDMLRIMLEVAATKFSEQTWANMTGLQYVTTEQIAQAQSMPSHPQSQQILQAPSWDKILGLLKNDLNKSYKIDVETNSTIAPEAAEDQKNISEVMTALGQYLQGITPLIQDGSFPFEGAKALMMAIVRRFQFGDEIEEYIQQMQPPQPPPQDGNPEAEMQLEQAKMQQQQQMEQGKAQMEQERMAQQMQMEQVKLSQQMQIEQEKINAQMQMKQMELAANAEIELQKARIDAETKIFIAKINSESKENANVPV